MPGELDSPHIYARATYDGTFVPTRPIRRERDAVQPFFGADIVRRHAVDAFGTLAPPISDLLPAFEGAIGSDRNRSIETIQRHAVGFRLASKKHRQITKWTTAARAATVGVDLGVGMLVVAKMHVAQGMLQGAGLTAAAHLKHAQAIGTELAVTGIAIGAETLPEAAEHGSAGTRAEHAQRLLIQAEEYPARAQQAAREREAAADVLRRLLGESGRAGYETACCTVDELAPAYARKVADALHAADTFDVSETTLGRLLHRETIPHFGFAPAKRFASAFASVGGTHVSRDLFGAVVNEYGYVGIAHNSALGRARTVLEPAVAPLRLRAPHHPDASPASEQAGITPEPSG